MEVILSPDLRLIMQEKADKRRENLPTRSEVAAIIPDAGQDYGRRTFRDIILCLRRSGNGPQLQQIDPSNAGYLPLHYVLLLPYSTRGWSWSCRLDLPARNNEEQEPTALHDELGDDGEDVDEPIEANTGRKSDRMSARAYYAFRIFTRPDDFNTLQRGCRLWQQYLVDAWATIEQSRLQWVTDHQDELRADLYKGLADAIAAADIDFQIAESCGRKIVLPSGHVGSARYMQSLFHDAMAIVQYKGPPTLFITFTANPNWEEITRELFPGQTVQDRPDLVARVFELKKKELLHELKQKAIFGKASARFWTIEYQKRGLPHCHLLLFLDDHDQFLQPDNID